MIVIRPKVWTSKPAAGARIRVGHHLATGLWACWLFSEGAGIGLRNLVVGGSAYDATITDPTNISWVPGRNGIALKNISTASVLFGITPATAVTTGTVWTWEALVRFDASGAYGALFGQSGADGMWTKASGQVNIINGGVQVPTTTAMAVGSWNHLVVVANGATGTCWINGRQDGATFTPASFAANCMLNDDQSESFRGICEYQRFWGRALDPSEIQELYVSPYGMIEPASIGRRRLSVPAGPTFLPAWARGSNRFIGSGLYAT